MFDRGGMPARFGGTSPQNCLLCLTEEPDRSSDCRLVRLDHDAGTVPLILAEIL